MMPTAAPGALERYAPPPPSLLPSLPPSLLPSAHAHLPSLSPSVPPSFPPHQVRFGTVAEAQRAQDSLNGTTLNNRTIEVREDNRVV